MALDKHSFIEAAWPVDARNQPGVRRWRAASVAYFRQQLTQILDLMGIGVPARM